MKEQDENHHRNAHANKEIYSGSVLPTPTSTTQPRLGFPLYSLGIQPRVVLQAHHTNLLFFQDHNEPLHMRFYKITAQTYYFPGAQRT